MDVRFPQLARYRSARAAAVIASLSAGGTAWAQNAIEGDMARVISSVAVLQQVAVPRQMCTNEIITTQGQTSGAGAVMGGVAGGAIGNQIGHGSGRAAATAIGIIGGAMLGNQIEAPGTPNTQTVQRCTTQTVHETRTVGHNVTYEYAGKQYSIQMPYDPGKWLQVKVTPVIQGVTSGY